MYAFRHELSLVRNSDANAILRAAAGNHVAKIILCNISWFVPHVTPSDENKMRLYKTIQNKSKIHCGFHMSQCDSIAVPQAFFSLTGAYSGRKKPKYIIVAFQTDRANDQTHNASVFNHCRKRNMHVTLKAKRYPAVDFNAGFTQNRVARVFKEASERNSTALTPSSVTVASTPLISLTYTCCLLSMKVISPSG